MDLTKHSKSIEHKQLPPKRANLQQRKLPISFVVFLPIQKMRRRFTSFKRIYSIIYVLTATAKITDCFRNFSSYVNDSMFFIIIFKIFTIQFSSFMKMCYFIVLCINFSYQNESIFHSKSLKVKNLPLQEQRRIRRPQLNYMSCHLHRHHALVSFLRHLLVITLDQRCIENSQTFCLIFQNRITT